MEEDPEIIESKNLIEICEYEKALQILENYAKKFPENIICTDLLADIYFKLGFDNKALRMFEKSAKKAPNENPDKYLSMAQLIVNPRERRQIYFKAVELYRKKISERDSSKKKKTPEDSSYLSDLCDSLSSALASIVSLTTTTDLCEDEDAEKICEECICEALERSPEHVEAMVQKANLRLIRGKDEEAKEIMNKIWEKLYNKKYIKSETINNTENNINLENNTNNIETNINDIEIEDDSFWSSLPERDILINISQNFAELSEYPKAIYTINLILSQDSSDAESLYFLLNYEFHLGALGEARETIEKFKKEYKKEKNVGEFVDVGEVWEIEKKIKEKEEGDIKEVEMKEK